MEMKDLCQHPLILKLYPFLSMNEDHYADRAPI